MLAARRLAKTAARAAAPARQTQAIQRRRFFLFGGGNNAPKGFGHFYPKGKTTTKGTGSKKTSGGAKASSTKKSSSGGGGGDGGGGMPPDGVPRIVSALAAIGLGVVWLSSRENQGTEINWQEFATVLLESGEVDRIIVTNSKVAEVLLRPNASVSLAKREEKTDELRDPYAWDAQQQQPPEKPTRYPRIGSSGPQQAPSYHFAIGSVEIFERKLEAAQRQLGIEPRDFVPVQYVSETNCADSASVPERFRTSSRVDGVNVTRCHRDAVFMTTRESTRLVSRRCRSAQGPPRAPSSSRHYSSSGPGCM